MLKADHFYYTDSTFQLELNLQEVRRELIQLIDEFEQQDCVGCFQIKCRCPNGDGTITTTSTNHPPSKNKDGSPIAPPADSLPRPTFEKQSDESPGASTPERDTVITDVETWIRSCGKVETPDKKVPSDLLTNLRKAEVSQNDIKYEVKEVIKEVNAATAVEAFFNSFKFQPFQNGNSSVTFITSKLATSYVKQQPRKAEYSYF